MKEHEVAMGFSAQLSAAVFHTALGPIFDDGSILVQHCTLSPGLVEQQGNIPSPQDVEKKNIRPV